jgi:hypothetical protein
MLPKLPNFGDAFCRAIGIVFLSCLGFTGCASWDTWRTQPAQQTEPDPDSQFGSQLRKPGPPGHMLGIDDRAREIERNLGVR